MMSIDEWWRMSNEQSHCRTHLGTTMRTPDEVRMRNKCWKNAECVQMLHAQEIENIKGRYFFALCQSPALFLQLVTSIAGAVVATPLRGASSTSSTPLAGQGVHHHLPFLHKGILFLAAVTIFLLTTHVSLMLLLVLLWMLHWDELALPWFLRPYLWPG